MEVILVAIGLSLLFSAFFSGSEIAFVSTNKLRIQLQNIDNSAIGKILGGFVKSPERFLTALLIGNNVTIVVYGVFFSDLITSLWVKLGIWGSDIEALVFVVQTVLASIVVLLFAEFLPKAIFSINANRSLQLLAIPLVLVTTILSPLVWIVLGLSNFFLKQVLRIDIEKGQGRYDRVDLFHMISEESGPEEANKDADVDTEIFLNAIEFANTKVRDCMIPRTEIEAIEVNASIEELKELLLSSGHSKILVYKETIDDIIGYVHSIGLFNHPDSIMSIILPIPVAPESMQASTLLRKMIDKRRSMAQIVDEFGGTAGIVTVEDIVEEIFGEIEDEHDVEALYEKVISPTEFIFSARCEISYLNEKYHISLPEGDYDTLGGFIINENERIPELGEKVVLNGFEAIIRTLDGARIGEIHLVIVNNEE